MQKKILIIEDEEELVKGIKINLEREGYNVIYALDGKAGLDAASKEAPDLILLDIMLPELDGLEVCRKLRGKNIRAPIIMLTAKSEEVDKIVGLEVGADDYITKPFSIREVLARIKAHLRRGERDEKGIPGVFRFDDIEIDFIHFKIIQHGREHDLTSLEVEILKYFVAHRGEVVSRNDLLERIWGYEKYPSTRTIDNHVMKLRFQISQCPVTNAIVNQTLEYLRC